MSEDITKTVREAIERSLDSTLGTLDDVESHAKEVIEHVMNQNKDILPKFEVNETALAHSKKSWWGKLKDWFVWKTPLRRVLVKPYWVQVELADVLERCWDHGSLSEDITSEEFDKLYAALRGVMVWEKKWPTNPYEVLLVDMTFQPAMPISYIKSTFRIDKEKS